MFVDVVLGLGAGTGGRRMAIPASWHSFSLNGISSPFLPALVLSLPLNQCPFGNWVCASHQGRSPVGVLQNLHLLPQLQVLGWTGLHPTEERKKKLSYYYYYYYLLLLFWLPHDIGSSLGRDQIWATGATYVTAAATLDPLTHWARDWTSILELQSCHQSHCTTVETPKLSFLSREKRSQERERR